MAKIKLKSHSGAKKRFKTTASGKIKVRKTNRRHLMSSKNAKRRRRLRESHYLSPGFTAKISALLPYS